MERRLAEAEARGETAAVLAAQAEQVEEQAHVAAVTAEAAVSACSTTCDLLHIVVAGELLCWASQVQLLHMWCCRFHSSSELGMMPACLCCCCAAQRGTC